jgi:lipopolysaccharide export system permease protein
MTRLTRYIFLQCLGLTLFVALGLTTAFWLIGALRLIEAVIDRGNSLWTFIHLILLTLPQMLELTLPVACFVGVQFSYAKLVADSELVVMRACGAAQSELARPAIILGAVATLMMLSITLYFSPVSKHAFKTLQFQMRNQFTGDLLQEGSFTPVSSALTVYVKSHDSVDQLHGIVIQDERDPMRPVTLTAKNGVLVQTDDGPHVVLFDGSRQTWDQQKYQLYVLTFDRWNIDIAQYGGEQNAHYLQPDERFLGGLFFPSPNEMQDAPYRLRLWVEGHNRLTLPLYCLSFVFVALASILTGDISRRGQIPRVAVAWLAVTALEASSVGVTAFAAHHAAAVLLMYLNPLLPIALSLMLIFSSHGFWNRWRDFVGVALPAPSP